MIWNNEKYKPAIEALGDMTWPVRGLRDNHIFQNHLGDWVSRQVAESGCLEVGGIRRPTPHVLSDFEAMCIISEFALLWLAERHVLVNIETQGETKCRGQCYVCRDGYQWLDDDGVFSEFGLVQTFTDRHEALAEAMLAVLREEEGKP